MSAIKGRLFVASFCFTIPTFKERLSILLKNIFQFFFSLEELNSEGKLWTDMNEANTQRHTWASSSGNHCFLNLTAKPCLCLMAVQAKSILVVWAVLQVHTTSWSFTSSYSSPSEVSSESQGCTVELFSCQLLQSCSLHVTVHFNPLARHWQLGSLQTEVHLQDKNSAMASGAGDPLIQQTISFPSS